MGSAARVLGRYLLHGELASGGMATVHLGRVKGEAGFTRTVAIKRLHPQFAKDPDFVAMFVDEARLAARIRHPNVVPTLDVITDGAEQAGETGQTEIFLVMEYVPGESLSRLLRTLRKRKQRIPPRIAITVLSGVLHGLHAAHQAKSEKGAPLGLVHRDVSPQNILVGTDGTAHVLDFGVAKAVGRLHTTRDGELKGKLAYMAPEQLETQTLTQQSDVYAAAVVLWEALTLRRLFEADNEGALLMQIIDGNISPPSKYVSGISREVDDVVMRGLARDTSQRWQTARDFAVALERCAPLAPASEIGEWVQSIAGEVLAERAKLVGEIEAGSMSLPAAAPSGPDNAGEPASQVSAIAMSSSEPVRTAAPAPASGRSHFAAGALAATVVVLLLLAFRRGGAHTVPAVAAPPPDETVMPAPPPSEAPRAPPTGISAEEPSMPPPPPPADTPSASAVPPTTPRTPARPPPPPKPAAKSRVDCDPPFTQDAVGHKHYKLQCL